MTKKCGIATVYAGYNYGSALQAYATKQICKDLGYQADVIKIRGFSKSRDIRIKKILAIVLRTIKNPSKFKKLKAYSKNNISKKTKKYFDDFYDKEICPKSYSYNELRKACKEQKYAFCLCGSDQIWNSTTDYIDPFYYLRFIERRKRIAYAPSFGRDYIPKENQALIKKYVDGIVHLSVREESGKELIKRYIGRDATVLIDPTLVLSREEWIERLNLKSTQEEDTVLLYFLNEPNKATKKLISDYCESEHVKPILVLSNFNLNTKSVFMDAGPKEFLELINSSKHVFTDSFHGMIFSANFNKPFSVFPREYNGATEQSTRIDNFLTTIKSKELYNPKTTNDLKIRPDFRMINRILNTERDRSIEYLSKAIEEVVQNEK